MKNIKILFLTLALSAFSCKDYLKEELVSQVTYDYYNSESGIEDLVDGAYSELRFLFSGEVGNGEASFTLTNYGVDEYKQAADGQFKHFDSYTAALNPSGAGYIHLMWTAYYRGINMCNLGLQWIPGIDGTQFLKDEAGKNQRMAELRFLRAFYYFSLVQQFGSVPLVLEGSTEVRTEFTRSPVPQVYERIIKDLLYAESILKETPSQGQTGRVTKGAARHYLAKVYLTRGSAVQDERGQKATDMDSAAFWAEKVIAMAPAVYSLFDNYADLWKPENMDNNKETIFAAQFNNSALLLNNSGNRVHLYYQMVYDNKAGMQRDINYGRPFRRLQPTDYTLDVFDRKNDSRFYKSFRTVYLSNNGSNLPKWTKEEADKGYVDQSKVGTNKFNVGDTAIFLTLHNNVPDAEIAKKPYLWIPRNKYGLQEFLTLVKFLDPTRLDISTEFSQRDGIYARLAETYLIAAEAYGRLGNYSKAVEYINVLRRRAAYKGGEEKPNHFWLTEGGTKGDVNSTEAALLIDETYWDTDKSLEQYPESATSKETRFIHFILNERTRELLGELHRWMDLVRTETFYERVKKFNPNAAPNVQPHHKLRPIPQEHIDRLWRDGKPLTDAAARAAEQNAGY